MYFISILEKWKYVLLLILFPIHSDTILHRHIKNIEPNYYGLQRRTSSKQTHLYNGRYQEIEIYEHPENLVREASNDIGTPSSSTKLSLFQMMGITDVAREIDFVLTTIISRVLSLLQGVTDILHRGTIDHSTIERQLILGSSGLGLVAAVGVGLGSIFQSEIASAIQSVDLSRTPLSPLSGLQNIIVAALQGKFSRESCSSIKP